MNRSAFSHLLWILAGAVFGFASAFVFGDLLQLPRRWFLVPHLLLTAGFLLAYARWSGTDLRKLWTRRLFVGVLGAALVAVVLILNVVSQPSSPGAQGLQLWVDVLWMGVAYGAADGLLLSVLPLVASWRAGARLGWTARRPGRFATACMGLVASAVVTTGYQSGYAEIRGQAMRTAILGNSVMSVAQLLTASPVTSTAAHAAMPVAAVLHGPDTPVQLPPHQ